MTSQSLIQSQLNNTDPARSIGDIWVATKRLDERDLQRILECQEKEGLPFGEAAIALKILSKDDIDFALNQQFDYAYLNPGDTSVSPQLVAAYNPFSRIGENLRAVRSQLMLRWFNDAPKHKVLAVVSPGKGEGRSFVAANLAVVFAQHGEKTLLIDGDLRATAESGQQALFKLSRSAGLSGVLADRVGPEVVQQVSGLPGLFVLAAGALPPNPQELLGRSTFDRLLRVATDQFDVVLIDTPPGDHFADAEIIAARAGAAMLVARKNQSAIKNTNRFVTRLQNGGVAMVGAVLNDA
jgi:receptor protein-tyrosine kinase